MKEESKITLPVVQLPNQISNMHSQHDKNVEYSIMLQSTFFRTSSPILGISNKKKFVSNINIFPPSSFEKCISFKKLKTDDTSPIYLSKSLDYRKKGNDNNSMKENDRNTFISLFNLISPPKSGLNELRVPSHNPTNIFFTNSQSYASLKETDIDSGKESLSPIYKETNLDKSFTLESRSFNDIAKDDNDPNHAHDGASDQYKFNTQPINTNSLYVRLSATAESPAQIRVTKSITKLHIPEWMNGVEFSGKRLVSSQCTTPEIQRPLRNTNYITLQTRLKKYKSTNDRINYPKNIEQSTFSLPSARFKCSGNKLEPITLSKARLALDSSRTSVSNSLSTYDISEGMVLLSKEFLSHLTYTEEKFLTFISKSTKNSTSCTNSHCSKKARLMTFCDQCFETYCSSTCLKEDRKNHIIKCNVVIVKKKLAFLLDFLSKTQIMILAQIFELGQHHLGKGFILWNVENNVVKKSLQFRLPRFVLMNEAVGLDVLSKLKALKEHEFLFIITLKDCNCNSLIVVSQCFQRHFAGEDLCDLIPNKSYKRSNLNREKREELVKKIVMMLRSFNVDLETQCPATYLKMMEYVISGCWFVQQVIKVCDPSSGSIFKIILEPDQVPQQILL